jgi:uroporphyrinogen decarboxylase
MGGFTAQLVNRTVRDYLTDAETMVAAQLAADERYKPDIVVLMADLLMETEAMGGRLTYPEDAVCYMREPVLKDKGELTGLKIPDPLRDGRLPLYLAACRQVREKIEDAPVGGVLTGPWSIAAHLRGIENLIHDTFKDPGFVHELLDFCITVAKTVGDALLATGAGLSYSEPTGSCSVISPSIYRKFIKDRHVELMRYFREKRAAVTLHICGNIDPIMEDVVEAGPAAVSIDSVSSLAKMVRIFDRRTVIIGNVDTSAFESGSRERIEVLTRACIDTAAATGAFILSSACEVPPTATPESVDFFMEAARKYGSYAR